MNAEKTGLRTTAISLLVLSVNMVLFGANSIYTGLLPKGMWAVLLGFIWVIVGIAFAIVVVYRFRTVGSTKCYKEPDLLQEISKVEDSLNKIKMGLEVQKSASKQFNSEFEHKNKEVAELLKKIEEVLKR
ncbi:MAG: hypothetical protein JRN15_02265 [Nitrososphaerota archaeon]|nr:hypothetical protein [Nitrososphaerota archaeon]